jgi:hypothetical protein
MSKPSISKVTQWDCLYESDTVAVLGGSANFPDDYWKVIVTGKKPKYFYGESAYSDAKRYATDHDIRAYVMD